MVWSLLCVGCWSAWGFLVGGSWAANRPPAFLPLPAHLPWGAVFPAVTVCETANLRSIPQYNYSSRIEAVVQEIAFFHGQGTFLNYHCRTSINNCPLTDYKNLTNQIRKNCAELFGFCRWNDIDFDCCKVFFPLPTEYGICFTVNSINTLQQNIKSQSPRMFLNRSHYRGDLSFSIKTMKSIIFIHSKEDIPNHNWPDELMITAKAGLRYLMVIATSETISEQALRSQRPSYRNCRFVEESDTSGTFRFYSYTACQVKCRENLMTEMCGCIPHVQPGSVQGPACNLTGLICIARRWSSLLEATSRHSLKPCICQEVCERLDVDVLQLRLDPGYNEELSDITISMARLPAEKFKRIVVKGNLDTVVAIGSLGAFFVGASFLSALEFIYFLTIRPLTNTQCIHIQVK